MFRTVFLRTSSTLLIVSAVFACSAQAQSPLHTADYVVQISVDALRGDLLRDLVANEPTTYSNFYRLQSEGASTYNARTDYFFTQTVPNHISMITGRPVNQPAGADNTVHHGYSNNFPGPNDTIHANGNPNAAYKASTFDVVHDNGLSTALYTSKTRLEILNRSYNATNGAPDTTGVDNGTAKIDTSMIVDGSSAGIANALATQLATSPANYSFIHLVEPDTVGHRTGWGNPAWNASVQDIDARLSVIFDAIDNNPILSGHTAIVLTGDHGGGVDVHNTATAYVNYNVPLFIWGAGLPADTDLYTLPFNRFDPGMDRPAYGDPAQPWRNGDTANLSMMILGLDPIPDSYLVPVAVPEPVALELLICALTLGLMPLRAQRRK
ncbi:MAG: alkaline phosphatase family protein [Planctomycetales bacterium]|nr:alkaline phosphatase family protein [Planctomycetales bacterium]